jgi:hypothetical protein
VGCINGQKETFMARDRQFGHISYRASNEMGKLLINVENARIWKQVAMNYLKVFVHSIGD